MVGTLFLDLSKAFEFVNHDLLLKKLAVYHFSQHSIDLFKSYLRNRKQLVQIDNIRTTLPPLQTPVQLPPIHGNLQPLNTNLNLSPLLNTLPPPPDRLPPLTFRPEILKPKMPELKPIALFSPRPARLTPLKRRHYVQHTPIPENPEPTTSNSAAIKSLNTPSPVEQYSPVHFPLIQISPELWMIPT